MSCRELMEGIANADSHAPFQISDDIKTHAKTCPACKSQVEFLEGAKKQIQSIFLNPEECSQVKKYILSQLPPPEKVVIGSQTQEWNIPKGFPFSRLIFALSASAAVLFILIIGSWMFRSPISIDVNQPAYWARVTGNFGFLEFSKQRIPLSQTQCEIASDSRLILENSQSSAKILYSNQGEIDLRGKGKLLVLPSGFLVVEGKFTSLFKLRKSSLEVIVPHATLAIRGTRIGFEIFNGTGSIEVLEGKVLIIPEKETHKSFELKTGERLAILVDEIMLDSSSSGFLHDGIPNITSSQTKILASPSSKTTPIASPYSSGNAWEGVLDQLDLSNDNDSNGN